MNKYAIYCDSLEDEQMLKNWIKKESGSDFYSKNNTLINKFFLYPSYYPNCNGFKMDYHVVKNLDFDPEYTKINIKDFLKEYYKMNNISSNWCIKITEENEGILYPYWEKLEKGNKISKSFSYDWNKRDFHGWLVWNSYDGSYLNWSDKLPENYQEINIKQFKKHILNMKTELLGLPIIKGEQHHLEAFAKDCETFGYKTIIGQTPFSVISHNIIGMKNILSEKSFTDLYLGSTHYQKENIKEFQLPTQWQEALDFMKENMDRWNKIQEEKKQPEFKVGDWVYAERGKGSDYRKDEHVPIFQIKDINNGMCIWLRAEKGFSNGVSSEYCRKATPQEIEEYNNNRTKIFKMTSTSGDFELEVSKKGIYYRPEDTYLQPKSILEMCGRRAVFNGKNYTMPTYEQYDVKYETVKVGCKYGCSIQQFQEVYDYYKSLQ